MHISYMQPARCGKRYFVSILVSSKSIAAMNRPKRLSAREALALLKMVCGSCTSRVEHRNVCVNCDADDEEDDDTEEEEEEDRGEEVVEDDDDINYEIN